MKKMIKLSLVAAVAVAGLTTTASAQPLEEAIKGVDVSGTVVYRYDDQTNEVYNNATDDADSTSTNHYKVGVNLKSKINDNITFNSRFTANSGFGGLDTQAGADGEYSMNIVHANFAVTAGNATITAGKQALNTPWTVGTDSDSNEHYGTGILAIVPAGPVTLAAGYFNQSNVTVDNDIAVVAALANVGGVALDAWYLETDRSYDTYSIGAKATIAGVTADARYVDLDLEGDDQPDNNMMYLKLSANVGPVALYGAIATTDKEGGLTALDSDAKNTIQAWNTNVHNKADADFFHLRASMDVMSGLNAAINYAEVEHEVGINTVEEEELFAQLTYTMGKNFSTYARFGTYDVDTENEESTDRTRGRLQVEYKF